MISRRRFIQQAGTLASAAAVVPLQRGGPRYKLGLQLFTMRAAMARDVPGTLARVAAMGYEEVETYGFDPVGLAYYGLPAQAFAAELDRHKFTTPSGHYDLNRYAAASLDDFNRYVDRCILGAKALKQTYITWPFIDEGFRTIDNFKVVAARLNIAGERARKAGLQVTYHNSDFEFVVQNGQMGYDIILQETDPALVKLQMDLYWIAHGSPLTPHEWFMRQPGRYVMWHVKDLHRTNRGYTEVGNGTIDFTRIWPDAALSGLKHFFVEQGGNFTVEPFRSVSDSAEYVKRVLLK